MAIVGALGCPTSPGGAPEPPPIDSGTGLEADGGVADGGEQIVDAGSGDVDGGAVLSDAGSAGPGTYPACNPGFHHAGDGTCAQESECAFGFTLAEDGAHCSAWIFDEPARDGFIATDAVVDWSGRIYSFHDVPQILGGFFQQAYDFETGATGDWAGTMGPDTNLIGSSAVFFDVTVTMSGGRTRDADELSARVFTTLAQGYSTPIWQERSPLNHPRRHHTMTVIDDELYVFGGDAPGFVGELAIERAPVDLDGRPTSWTDVGTMPSAHRKPLIVLRGDLLYLVGGEEMEFTQNVVWFTRRGPAFLTQWEAAAGSDLINSRCVETVSDVICVSVTTSLPVAGAVERVGLDDVGNVFFERLGDRNKAAAHEAIALRDGRIFLTGGSEDELVHRWPYIFSAAVDDVLRSRPEVAP